MLSFGGNAHLWEEEKHMGNDGNSPLEAAWQTAAGSGMAGFNDQQQNNEFNIEAWQNGLDGNDDSRQPTSFTRAASNDAKMAAVLLCDLLGALCILLNAFVIVALIRNRRRVLVNVFYVLVLHCAIVDLIRGGCLIAWGMPHLLIHTMRSLEDRLLALKINQFTLVILRSCNLLTIFNLLVFTTNEFIVIKYPLHYRRYFRRRTVLFILAICWVVSLLFGIGSVFSNFFESAHSVMVQIISNGTGSIFQDLDLQASTMMPPASAEDEARNAELLVARFVATGNGVTRRQIAGLSVNVLSMLMIFVLCYVCLFTVLVCYGKILRTIRQFQKCGNGGPRRVLKDAGSENRESQKFGRTGSIYHKRSVHQQRTQQQACQQGTPTPAIRAQICQKAAVIGIDHGTADGDDRLNSLKKKVSMPGSPQSGASGSADQGCGKCPNCAANGTGEDQTNRSRRCNSHRKWRSHLMSRHKYLIVIGTVLFVDVLFLFPYSGIQMVALLHLNNLLATSQMTTLIRWGLQILIGVHSVCQPLCYFRMTEFRRLACCLGANSRRFGGSGSSAGSVFAGRSAKSVGSVKTFGLNTRDEDFSSAMLAQKKSIVLSTLVSDGSPMNGAKINAVGEESNTSMRDRTNWVNPSVGERQMLLIRQRRKWTRNLSLLCKEEGEELEVFLSREFKRREGQEAEKHQNAAQKKRQQMHHQKGGSLRSRALSEEDEEQEAEESGQKNTGSDGKLLERMRCRIKESHESEEYNEETNLDENVQIKVQEEDIETLEDVEDPKPTCTTRLLSTTQEEEFEEEHENVDVEAGFYESQPRKPHGFLRTMFGRLISVSRLGIGRGRKANGHGDSEEEPTLLDSDWKRPGEVHQFRSYGPNTELRPKISDLSGLRSNSVFTPQNLSANTSRQPSYQWGYSGGRKRSSKK